MVEMLGLVGNLSTILGFTNKVVFIRLNTCLSQGPGLSGHEGAKHGLSCPTVIHLFLIFYQFVIRASPGPLTCFQIVPNHETKYVKIL